MPTTRARTVFALELSVGAGLSGWYPARGTFVGGVYVTSYRLDEPDGTVSRSHGLVASFTVALSGIFENGF